MAVLSWDRGRDARGAREVTTAAGESERSSGWLCAPSVLAICTDWQPDRGSAAYGVVGEYEPASDLLDAGSGQLAAAGAGEGWRIRVGLPVPLGRPDRDVLIQVLGEFGCGRSRPVSQRACRRWSGGGR